MYPTAGSLLNVSVLKTSSGTSTTMENDVSHAYAVAKRTLAGTVLEQYRCSLRAGRQARAEAAGRRRGPRQEEGARKAAGPGDRGGSRQRRYPRCRPSAAGAATRLPHARPACQLALGQRDPLGARRARARRRAQNRMPLQRAGGWERARALERQSPSQTYRR
jgi:hypothetical protein